MSEAYQKLVTRFQELHRLDHAMTFLSWDQMVMMPPNGNDARSASIAEIASIRHKLLISPEVEDWINEASMQNSLEISRSLQEMERVWRQAACLPADLVVAKIKAGSHCEHGWRTQRGANDWAGFLKNFKPVVDLSREEAQRRQQAAGKRFSSPYEALLELHCAGDSQSLIDSVFSTLREQLPTLLQQVTERQKKSALPSLKGDYPQQQQQALCEELMTSLGFDFQSGRLDRSMHPFSTGEAGDLRITTRYQDDEFIEALNSTAHEVGHSCYEGGLPEKWRGLPVGGHRNMCIHESQSLLFEKQIFYSKTFLKFFTTKIHQYLPASKAIDADTLWGACTRVKPGFIRVEADEVCYPLHVLMRYEIESGLINGDIEADVLPDIWNEKMQSYLGLSTVGNFTDGVLQDIHWTDGAFGYFPSYTIGAVNSAQIFQALCNDFPDWQDRFVAGNLSFISEWLHAKIWSKGCELSSQDLMTQATGRGTSTDDYLAHLKLRYLDELH